MDSFISFEFSENGFCNIRGEKKFTLNDSSGVINEYGCLRANWSLSDHDFLMETDPYGISHLFFYENSGKFIASHYIKSVLERLPKLEIDYDALSIFFASGTFIGNDTIFKNIKILGPSGKLSIRNGRLSISENIIWSQEVNNLSIDSLRERYYELFKQSINNITEKKISKIALPISGGRDSRHIFLELIQQKININQLISTYYEPENIFGDDVELATMLSEESGVPVHIKKNDINWLKRTAKIISRLNFGSTFHEWYHPVSESIEEGSLVLDGLGGDVLSESKKYKQEVNDAFKKEDWEYLCKYYLRSTEEDTSIFSRSLQKKLNYESVKERMIFELKKYKTFNRPQSAFEFYNRTRRNISLPSQYLLKNSRVYYPFLDKELFSFLSSVPFDKFNNNDFHTSVISKFYPDYSHIPYSIKNRRLPIPYSIFKRLVYSEKKSMELINLILNRDNKLLFNKSFLLVRLFKDMIFPYSDSPSNKWIGPKVLYSSSVLKTIKSHRK